MPRYRANATVLGYSSGDIFTIDASDRDALVDVAPYVAGGHVTELTTEPVAEPEPEALNLPNLQALADQPDTTVDDLAKVLDGLNGGALRALADHHGVSKGGKLDDIRGRLFAAVTEPAPGAPAE